MLFLFTGYADADVYTSLKFSAATSLLYAELLIGCEMLL